MCIKAVEDEPETLEYVPNYFKTQKMCERTVEDDPDTLRFVPDHLKTQGMCERAIKEDSYNLKFVPDRFKMPEMSNEAVAQFPYALWYVPDYLKTQEMCDKAVKNDSSSLQFAPDWFVTREGVDMWHDDGNHWDDHNEDKFFEWYDGYKKRKAQKASIRKELTSIGLHPSRYWDWCMSEDENKEREKLWASTKAFLYLMTGYKNFFLPINFNH